MATLQGCIRQHKLNISKADLKNISDRAAKFIEGDPKLTQRAAEVLAVEHHSDYLDNQYDSIVKQLDTKLKEVQQAHGGRNIKEYADIEKSIQDLLPKRRMEDTTQQLAKGVMEQEGVARGVSQTELQSLSLDNIKEKKEGVISSLAYNLNKGNVEASADIVDALSRNNVGKEEILSLLNKKGVEGAANKLDSAISYEKAPTQVSEVKVKAGTKKRTDRLKTISTALLEGDIDTALKATKEVKDPKDQKRDLLAAMKATLESNPALKNDSEFMSSLVKAQESLTTKKGEDHSGRSIKWESPTKELKTSSKGHMLLKMPDNEKAKRWELMTKSGRSLGFFSTSEAAMNSLEKDVRSRVDEAPTVTKRRTKQEKIDSGLIMSDVEKKADEEVTGFLKRSGNNAELAMSNFKEKYKGSKEEWVREAHAILMDEVQWQKWEEQKPGFPKNGYEAIEQASKAKLNKNKWINHLSRYILFSSEKDLKKIKIKATKGNSYHLDGVVYLNPKSGSAVKLHEIIHAITVQKLAAPENKALRTELLSLKEYAMQQLFTPQEIAALKTMNTSRAFKENYQKFEALDYNKRGLYYAFINEKEFLAQAFSEPIVRDALSQIKSNTPSKFSNLLQQFRDYIRRVLNFEGVENNAFEKLLSIVDDLQRSEYSARDEGSYGALEINEQYSKNRKILEKQLSRAPSSLKERIFDNSKTTWEKVKGLSEDLLEPVTESLRKIDPRFVTYLRKMENRENTKNREYAKKVRPFLNKLKDMNPVDRAELSLYLFNDKPQDNARAHKLLKDNSLLREYDKVKFVLDDIRKRQKEVGINLYKTEKEDYFPRRVKDMDGLMDAVYNKYHKKDFQGPLASIVNDKKMSDATKKEKLSTIFNSGKYWEYAMKLPSSARDRSINRVEPEFLEFYHDVSTTLVHHIAENNSKIEGRVLLGGKEGNLKLQNKMNKLQERIEKYELQGKSTTDLEAQLVELQNKAENLDTFTDGDILEFIQSEKNLNIDRNDQMRLVKLLRARLNQRGMTGLTSSFRNVALTTALGSPMNAITQVGDLVWTIYKNGIGATAKAVFGNKEFTKDDFDFTHVLKEFGTDQNATGQALDKLLYVTGFQWMDQFGKEVSMQASLNKARSMTPEAFAKKWGDVFGGSKNAKEVHSKILKGIKDEDTSFFVFNDVSDFQPISLSEMPKVYLEAGNGRIFYLLKSYAIKSLANIRREMRDPKRSKTENIYAASKLVTLLVFANASIDEIKDAILGRDDEEDFSDKLVDNLLNLGFMSRYTTEKGFRSGKPIKEFLADVLLPPVAMVEAPLVDIYNASTENENTFKTKRLVPWFGQFLYSWGEEGEKQHLKNRREYLNAKIKESVADPSGFSETRKAIREYNKEVRKAGIKDIKPIKAQNIKRLKTEEKKKKFNIGPKEAYGRELTDEEKYVGSTYTRELVDASVKSKLVKILGQKGVEGFETKFYVPKGSIKSGATIANGIDFAYQSRNKFAKLGVPDYLLDKLDKLNLYGKKGKAAINAVKQLDKQDMLSEAEVNYLANTVTYDGWYKLEDKVGKEKWDTYSENQKIVATSLYHIYNGAWFKHSSYRQFLDRDWKALKANMADYKDKSKGVNNRHRIMSKYL